jgi:hypothetical protein
MNAARASDIAGRLGGTCAIIDDDDLSVGRISIRYDARAIPGRRIP